MTSSVYCYTDLFFQNTCHILCTCIYLYEYSYVHIGHPDMKYALST